jgi:hypothetical protein
MQRNAGVGQRSGDSLAVASDQHHRAGMPGHGGCERREVLALTVAAGDQHDQFGHAVQRSHGRTDVGAFRIVVEPTAGDFGHQLHTVRQTLEPLERGRCGRVVEPDGAHQRQSG